MNQYSQQHLNNLFDRVCEKYGWNNKATRNPVVDTFYKEDFIEIDDSYNGYQLVKVCVDTSEVPVFLRHDRLNRKEMCIALEAMLEIENITRAMK